MAPDFIPGAPGSPLSRAVLVNGLVFTAGQVGKRPDGSLPETFADQLDQALINLAQLLEEVGTSLSNVVKVTAFVTPDGWQPAFNEVYMRHFSAPYPARTRVEVARLAPGYLVELDAIATHVAGVGPK